MIKLTLHWRIPSKKNNKQRTWKYLLSSKQYLEREKEQLRSLVGQVEQLRLNQELKVNYKFYMPDNRKSDLSNKVESINDLLVKYWLLEDDNRMIIKELNMRCEWVDKNNPRCEIVISFIWVND